MTASSSPSRSTIATRQFRASASGSTSCLATALSQSVDSMCCMPSAMATTGSSCGARASSCSSRPGRAIHASACVVPDAGIGSIMFISWP
ncbi:hypothetical protein WJ970_34625 [Achromobacter xylosoxidans]